MRKIITIIIFYGIIGVSGLLVFILPKESFSEDENRVLAAVPKVQGLDDLTEKRFMENTDAFLSDYFPFRTSWIKLKTRAELMLRRKEVGGVYVLSDKLIQKLDAPSDIDISSDNDSISGPIDKTVSAINRYAYLYPEKNIYAMFVPTAAEIYRGELPVNAPNFDQKAFIDKVYKCLNPEIIKLDAYTPLQNEKKNYIYYKTDHHWTSSGAYTAYSYNAKSMGLDSIPIDNFAVQYASYSFLGTLYSKTLYGGVGKDVLDIYYPRENAKIVRCERFDGEKKEEYDSMFFMEQIDKKDKYSVFLGTNTAIVNLYSSANNGRKLLIFKDSYAHSMMQFLAPHYEQITLVDMRYISESTFVNNIYPEDYNNIMFLYNAGQFITDSSISNIGWGEKAVRIYGNQDIISNTSNTAK